MKRIEMQNHRQLESGNSWLVMSQERLVRQEEMGRDISDEQVGIVASIQAMLGGRDDK